MQSRFKSALFFSLIAVLFFTSCSKTNKEGRYIPSNAAFVVHLNGQSLSAKLPWQEIKQSELFKQAFADTTASALVKSVLDNPENTGIDVKKDILVFMVKDSAGGYLAVEGTLKDEAVFKQFNKELSENTSVESDKDGIHYSNTADMTAAWNKEKFVLVTDANMNGNRNRMRSLYDSSESYTPEIKRDRVPIAEELFNLKEDNSLGKEEKFTDLMKETGDIHFWLNMETLYAGNSDIPGMQALSMINLKKVYEGSRVTGTVNFENGKINADFKSYSGKEMTELVKKYSGDKINADMVKRIPSKNLAGMLAFNFKPEGLREYLKLLGVEGFANMGTAMLGFNLDDFVKANKGDILLAVTDISKDSTGKPVVSAIFSASIGDKPSFNKLVEAGNKFGKDKFNGESGPSLFYKMNDNYFALGTTQAVVDNYVNTSANTNFDFFDKISGSAGGAYINFQYILKAFAQDAQKDSFAFAMHDASLKMWDNMIAWGGGFKDGASTQHLEINLVDKSANSLKQLNNYLSTLGMLKKKQDERLKNYTADDFMNMADSSASIGSSQ